jgi:hypothetical protein
MKRALIALFLALAARGASAQDQVSAADLARLFLGKAADKPPQACVDKLEAAMKTPPVGAAADDFTKLLDTSTNPLCATFLILSSKQFAAAQHASGGELLADAEKQFVPQALSVLKAIAQQNGASTGTGGSTNLTATGLTSKLFSVASEYGALTESTSNDTTTVQGTLAGVPLALMQKGAMVECSTRLLALTPCLHQSLLMWMSRMSYSVSFATLGSSAATTSSTTSSATSTAALATSSTTTSGGLNAYGFKAVLVQGALNTSAYGDADKQIMSNAAAVVAVQAAQGALNANEVAHAAAFMQFLTTQAAALRATAATGNRAAVVAQWRALADPLVSVLGVPVTPDAGASSPVLQNAVKLAIAYTSYLGTEDAVGLATMLAVPPVLSVEFDQNRPTTAPENSVLRLIFQKTYKSVTMTVNGAVSIYDSAQPNVPGAGRLRDSQLAVEVAHPFTLSIPGVMTTNFTVSGAFYDQYQSSPAILNVTPGAPVNGVTFVNLPSTATQVYGTTGNIAVGQLKLTVGGGSAVTVPLSMTYSNRTELIAKPTWRAQIGISYDFDSLFASSSGGGGSKQ